MLATGGHWLPLALGLAVVPLWCGKWSLMVRANDFPSLLVANATVGMSISNVYQLERWNNFLGFSAIILDHEYLDTEYADTLAAVQTVVERVLREQLRTAGGGAGLNIRYYSWTQINFDKDFTAVISVSDCASTWRTFEAVRRESLVYIALTEADCTRLPANEAVMVPIIKVGQELSQIVLDVRAANAVNWKSVVLLYDETFGEATVGYAIWVTSMCLTISYLRPGRHQSRRRVSVVRVAPQQCRR